MLTLWSVFWEILSRNPSRPLLRGEQEVLMIFDIKNADVQSVESSKKHPVLGCVARTLGLRLNQVEWVDDSPNVGNIQYRVQLNELSVDWMTEGEAYGYSVSFPKEMWPVWNAWASDSTVPLEKRPRQFELPLPADWRRKALLQHRNHRIGRVLRWGSCLHNRTRLSVFCGGYEDSFVDESKYIRLPFFFRGDPTPEERQEVVQAVLAAAEDRVNWLKNLRPAEWAWFFSHVVTYPFPLPPCGCEGKTFPISDQLVLGQMADSFVVTNATHCAAGPQQTLYRGESLRRWPAGTFFEGDGRSIYFQTLEGVPQHIGWVGRSLRGSDPLPGEWQCQSRLDGVWTDHFRDEKTGRLFRPTGKGRWEVTDPM